jgi:hypothetical protein
MLRNLLIAFVLLSISTYSYAQDAQTSKVKLGIFCSPVLSWTTSDVSTISPDGSKFGINVGLSIERYFSSNYAFVSGVSIHTLGGTMKYQNSKDFNTEEGSKRLLAGETVLYKIQYADIPFALKMKMPSRNISFFAQIGGNMLIPIKSKADLPSINNIVIKKEIEPFIFGYHAMIGIEKKVMANSSIVVGLNYFNGLTDFTADNEKNYLSNAELRIGLIF